MRIYLSFLLGVVCASVCMYFLGPAFSAPVDHSFEIEWVFDERPDFNGLLVTMSDDTGYFITTTEMEEALE